MSSDTKTKIIKILQSLFSNVDAACKNEGYITFMLSIVQDQKVDFHTRLMGSVVLKNFIKKSWEKLPYVQDKKNFLKNIISVVVTLRDKRIIKTMNLILGTLALEEYPHNWPYLVPALQKYFQSNNLMQIRGAMILLVALVNRYKFDCSQGENDRMELRKVVNAFVPLSIKLFKYVSTLKPTQELVEIKHLCAKLFYKAFNNMGGTCDFFMANPKSFEDFMDNLVVKELQDFQSKHISLSWNVKKWLLHYVTRKLTFFGFREAEMLSERENNIKKIYLNKYIGKCLTIFLKYIEKKKEIPQITNRVICMCVTYFQFCCLYNPGNIFKMIQNQLQSIFNILLPFLFFNKKDNEMAQNNPALFANCNYEIQETFFLKHDIKINVVLAFKNLVNQHRHILKPLVEYLSNILKKSDSNASVKDGVLFVLGNIAAHVCVHKEMKFAFEAVLMKLVAPNLSSNMWFLKSKAMWVCGMYAGIKFKNPSNVVFIVTHILNNLKNPNLIVREQAGSALCGYLQYDMVMNEAKKHLPTIFQCFIDMMSKYPSDMIFNSLEIVVESFKAEVLPFSFELIKQLVMGFLKMYEAYGNDDDESVPAFSQLRAIGTVCKAINNPEAKKKFDSILLPFYHVLLNEDPQLEFLEHALQIISYHTYEVSGFSEGMWQLFVRLFEIFYSDGFEFVDYFTPIFDNYISCDTKTFLANPNCVELIVKWCEGLLDQKEKFKSREMKQENACELISCVLHNCKGSEFFEKKYFSRLLFVVIKRLSAGTVTNTLSLLLINCICDSLYFNCEMTVSFMMMKNCFDPIIKIWWEFVPKLYRAYDRKITVLALAKLIEYSFKKKFNNNFVCQAALLGMKCLQENQKEEMKKKAMESQKKEHEQKIIEYEVSQGHAIKKSDHFKAYIQELTEIGQKKDMENVDVVFSDPDFSSPILDVDEKGLFKAVLNRLKVENTGCFKTLLSNSSMVEKKYLMSL